MCSWDLAWFRPTSWYWLKPLSLNRPTSLTRPALKVALFAAPPIPASSRATSAITGTASATGMKRLLLTYFLPRAGFHSLAEPHDRTPFDPVLVGLDAALCGQLAVRRQDWPTW